MRSSNMSDRIQRELGNEKDIIQCAARFGLVGDATRMKICWLLCKHKELSVGEIANMLGVSVSVVSHSLKRLKQFEMVQSRKEHKQVFYALSGTDFSRLLRRSLDTI